MRTPTDLVKVHRSAAPSRELTALTRVFPLQHFERLRKEEFPFYRTTFWYPLDRGPENVFEAVARSLKPLAKPSSKVTGVEWWFSVVRTNSTPQWILPLHFDREDMSISERDVARIKQPERASVLFLNTVPYGDLVVTDQVLPERGARPKQPEHMSFVRPSRNLYAVFPGHLYHGVIGRMWRPLKPEQTRIAMAVNWWPERPAASYLRESRDCMAAFRLA